MARRFQFNLQKILDLRLWEEKQAENLLSAKTGQCATCERTIVELSLRRREAFLSRGVGGLDLNVWAFHDRFRLRLDQEISNKEKELARLTLEREELLKAYLQTRRRREVLSKLAERQTLAFKKDEQKREALQLDDLNTAVFIRKMRRVEETLG